jgi:hypothetical protein
LEGKGTKVKMQKGTPPTVEELEQEIRKNYLAAKTSGDSDVFFNFISKIIYFKKLYRYFFFS